MTRLRFLGVAIKCLRFGGSAVAIGCLLLASSAFPDVIVDDFDEAASAVSPALKNVFVTTFDVGSLNAKRRLRIGAAAADPDVRVEIGSSNLHAQVGDLHPNNRPVRPIVAVQLAYTFEPEDLTSGNAFFVDFQSVKGSPPPDFLRVLIFDDQLGLSYFDTFSPIPLNSTFSAVLPFKEFRLRNGAPWPIHFDSVREIWVELFASRSLGDYSNHAWTAEVDRFRVGRVPEPSGMSCLLMTLLWRRRRCAPYCSSYCCLNDGCKTLAFRRILKVLILEGWRTTARERIAALTSNTISCG